MEKFRTLVYPLLDYLWDLTLATDVIEPIKEEEFVNLLTWAIECLNVRKFVTQKQLIREKLDRRTLLNASLFLRRVIKGLEDGKAQQEGLEKRACLEGLDDRTLGILAVILKPDDIYKRSTNGVKALSEGARRIATWPCWRNQPELVEVVREQRPPITPRPIPVHRPATTTTAQPTRFSPAPPPAQPFHDHPKNTLPPSIGRYPTVAEDTTPTAAQSRGTGITTPEADQPIHGTVAPQPNQPGVVHPLKDQLYGGKPQDPDAEMTEDPAPRRLHSAPSTPEEPQPKRLNAGAHEQRGSVCQDSGGSMPRSVQLRDKCASPSADTKYAAEGLSEYVRRCCVMSVHTGEALIWVMKGVDSIIKFEYEPGELRQDGTRKPGWYVTKWINNRFRIVMPENKAQRLYVTQHLGYFEISSSEIASLFVRHRSFMSLHVKKGGGITMIDEVFEVQWKQTDSL
ncbi:uncharacterized protein P884DRAFT_328257, partial [Thermothelomyces heterothallicus CBS 202.75]|uniref:uncharacterized protein n=1 Tax=Thermothelomyces heterothallicus CBS 202.75 TaxID=1149848 RepID=UPI0037435CA1